MIQVLRNFDTLISSAVTEQLVQSGVKVLSNTQVTDIYYAVRLGIHVCWSSGTHYDTSVTMLRFSRLAAPCPLCDLLLIRVARCLEMSQTVQNQRDRLPCQEINLPITRQCRCKLKILMLKFSF